MMKPTKCALTLPSGISCSFSLVKVKWRVINKTYVANRLVLSPIEVIVCPDRLGKMNLIEFS